MPAAAVLAQATPAFAQIRGYYSSDPNVSVDLSVLGGPGNEPVAATPLPTPAAPQAPVAGDLEPTPSGLLFPPPVAPRSRLVGQYSAAVPQVREPTPRTEPQPRRTPPQSRLIAPAPAPTPAPAGAPQRAESIPLPKPAVVPPAKPTPATAPTVATLRPATPTPAAPAPVPPPPTLPQPVAAPEPAMTPAPALAKPVAAVETAARTPSPAAAPAASAAAPDTDGQARILFDSGSAKLPDAARDSLQSLVAKLDANENLRVQLEAYAKGTNDTASQARRLSLSRALAVRSYLIDQGVRSTRMDVRALGNKPTDPTAPADRVDAKLVER